MDQVTVEDESGRWVQFDLDGPQAPACLHSSGIATLPDGNGASRPDVAGIRTWLIEQRGLTGRGFRLVAPQDHAGTLAELLEKNGAIEMSTDLYDVLRVEAGFPGPSGELVDAHTPLEIGLHEFISSTKGCYTGQEVIARQITYGKVVRSLHGLRLTAPAATGSRVLIGGKPAGLLTSSVHSPQFGPIALAVLRTQAVEALQAVEVEQDGQLIEAEIAALPFH